MQLLADREAKLAAGGAANPASAQDHEWGAKKATKPAAKKATPKAAARKRS